MDRLILGFSFIAFAYGLVMGTRDAWVGMPQLRRMLLKLNDEFLANADKKLEVSRII